MNEWLPDWTDPANYPAPETTSMAEWAWEFLRRNPLYQSDYKELMKELEEMGYNEAIYFLCSPFPSRFARHFKGFDKENVLANGGLMMSDFSSKYRVRHCHGGPPPNPELPYEEELSEFIHTTPPLSFYNFFSYIADKSNDHMEYLKSHCLVKYFTTVFGSLQDEHRLAAVQVEAGMNKEACLANIRRTPKHFTVAPRSLVVQINLERPLTEQIKTISEVAIAQQKQLREWGVFKEGRKTIGNYGTYLRSLDALETGAETQNILDTIFPNVSKEASVKAYDYAVKKALKLRDSGYLNLISMPDPKTA